MKHVHTFDSFLNEANISFYKSTVVAALKELGYNVKQADLKIGTKKESNYDLITLNGELLCSSSEYAQMVTWIKNAVTEDPKKYGLDPKVLESSEVNETDLSYWKDYEADDSEEAEGWETNKVKSVSDTVALIDKCIKHWNDNASKEATDRVSKPSEKHIGDLAMQFFKKFGYINGAIIQAMIAQES
jgi:hypothetical protein